MKKTMSTLFFCCLAAMVYAQLPTNGGPDQFGYTFNNSNSSQGPTYNWFDISTIGTQVSGLSDDNFVGPFPMSGFPYYTSNPTQFWIGSNGYISFSPVNIASTAASFPIIPTVGGPNGFIAPFLSDLTFGGAASNPGKVYRYDQGDTLCISFENVPFWVNNGNQYGGDNTFQVILNRADSSITFNYQKQLGAPDPVYVNNYISIGIESPAGNDGLQYYRGATTAIALTSVKFDYPTIIQPVTDIEVDWVDNAQNAGRFIASNAGFTPTANIKNAGNQAVNSTINISYTIENSIGALVNIGFTTLPSLGIGQDTTLVLGNSFSPGLEDDFKFTAYVSGVNMDNTLSNDTSRMLFKSIDTTSLTQVLNYTNGTNTTGSLGWSGGNGGVAVYFEPPYYPARVISTQFFITTLGNPPVGFYSLLYDDARASVPGNLLDSALIPQSQISTGIYHVHPLTNNVVINSGGVYLLWLMEGDGINIGQIAANPASRNTYEVLFGSWSNYRGNTTEDFMMGIEIEPLSVGLDSEESNNLAKVYPNPARDHIWIETKETLNLSEIQIFDQSGKLVQAKILISDKKVQVLRGNLPTGTYYMNYNNTFSKLVFMD